MTTDSISTAPLHDLRVLVDEIVAEEHWARIEDDVLRQRLMEVVAQRFPRGSRPMTLQRLGEHWGVGREQVRQVEARLLGIMRRPGVFARYHPAYRAMPELHRVVCGLKAECVETA